MAIIYKQVAAALAEQTFDIVEAEGGWPDINWLIANYLLRDYDDFIRHKSIDGMVAQVKNCLAIAISYAEDTLGVKIFRGYTNGNKGKLLEFITPNAEYKQAKEKDYGRIWRQVERVYVKAQRDVERRLPEIGADRFTHDTAILINKQQLISA